MKTDFGGSFLVMGAFQNTKANFPLLPICNRHIVCGSYFGFWDAPVEYAALGI